MASQLSNPTPFLLLLLPFIAITIQPTTCTRLLEEVSSVITPPADEPLRDPFPSPEPTLEPPVEDSTSEHPLTFFMHDVSGIGTSEFINNQLPSTTTDAAGFAQNTNNNENVFGGSGGVSSSKLIPFVNGDNFPAVPTLQNLLFGTTTVIDDELMEQQELGSAVIGRAKGFYVSSSQDGTSRTVMFTAMMQGEGKGEGDYSDTVSFFGVYRKAAAECYLAVVGGTGKYENAGGFAAIQTVNSVDQHTTDGDVVGTVLRISVHLS